MESKVPHSRIDIGAGMSMDDAIEFMKAVETARPDVYEGEKERENLEIRYQVGNALITLTNKYIVFRHHTRRCFTMHL